MPLIHSLTAEELAEACLELKAHRFRARQVWNWLYVQAVSQWPEMKNVPEALRAALAGHFSLESAVPVEMIGEPDATRKILAQLIDGEQIEEVLIPAGKRRTVCVSSQVGCRYLCAFCASGQAGFRRDLEAGEMVGQVLVARRLYGARPSHVVFMGIGEPFDNYDAVLRAVRIINDEAGLNIGARRITISTCGIVPGIRQLAEEGLQVELSVSLHTTDDDERSALMLVSRKYPLAELLDACGEYSSRTGRIVTFEYTLIKGVNDSDDHARALAHALAPLKCRVNLIPLSPVDEYPGEPSSLATANRFIDHLSLHHINATLRASKGASLKAACGQLRYRHPHEDRTE